METKDDSDHVATLLKSLDDPICFISYFCTLLLGPCGGILSSCHAFPASFSLSTPLGFLGPPSSALPLEVFPYPCQGISDCLLFLANVVCTPLSPRLLVWDWRVSFTSASGTEPTHRTEYLFNVERERKKRGKMKTEEDAYFCRHLVPHREMAGWAQSSEPALGSPTEQFNLQF